jgi:uncharacterized protein YicC (UPF0701 family)
MGPEHLALMIPLMALGIPISAIITAHLREMARIKARGGSEMSNEIRAELNEMKSQLAALRDTTTKFDMTFDAALERLEQRVDRIEERQVSASSIRPSTAAEPDLLTLGGRTGA